MGSLPHVQFVHMSNVLGHCSCAHLKYINKFLVSFLIGAHVIFIIFHISSQITVIFACFKLGRFYNDRRFFGLGSCPFLDFFKKSVIGLNLNLYSHRRHRGCYACPIRFPALVLLQ